MPVSEGRISARGQAAAQHRDQFQAFIEEGEQTIDQLEEDPTTALTSPEIFAEVNRQAEAAGLSGDCRIDPTD